MIVQLLVRSNADINLQDAYGFSALHRAALIVREAMTRLLLERGPNPNLRDKDQLEPLHVAVIKRHVTVVQLLLHLVDDQEALLFGPTSGCET